LFFFFFVFFFFGYFLLTQGSPTRVVMGRVFFMTGLFKSSMSLWWSKPGTLCIIRPGLSRLEWWVGRPIQWFYFWWAVSLWPLVEEVDWISNGGDSRLINYHVKLKHQHQISCASSQEDTTHTLSQAKLFLHKIEEWNAGTDGHFVFFISSHDTP